MDQAVTAGSILPAIAAEPAELGSWFSLKQTAGSLLKTADFKGYPCWVEKSMFMLAIDTDGLFLTGNGSTAGAADQWFCFLFLPLTVTL